MNGTIERWRRIIRTGRCGRSSGAEEENASQTRACLFLGQVGRVTVDVQLHVTGVVAKHSIRVSGAIFQQLCHCGDGGFCAIGLG